MIEGKKGGPTEEIRNYQEELNKTKTGGEDDRDES